MLTAIERKTKDAQLESSVFNSIHQVGTTVEYWNGNRQNGWIDTVTRSSAFAVGETSYILLADAGRIPLSRIKVIYRHD
ncbi:hypothetical protein [Gimesia aquarii]|uniref:Uncharacterized protein n=1 Tax=Gimesia aquarii TaxID=2527964 RepID=A0A517VR73_9PLAN|nr:hypothetical protein [Gimesia aquarii]QDT95524.1 hypothetical protein V144x_09690 [Gimesia aquarii]